MGRLYIFGYHPAQKWLRDRRGSQLIFSDIMYYVLSKDYCGSDGDKPTDERN